jgi:hypothetical protein
MYISNSKARKVVYLMMQHITGTSQSAIFSSLEDTILKTPFVLSMLLSKPYHFTNFRLSVQTIKAEDGPSFDTKIFQNLFVWVSKWSAECKKARKGVRSAYRIVGFTI